MTRRNSDLFLSVVYKGEKRLINLSEKANWNYAFYDRGEVVWEHGPDTLGSQKRYSYCEVSAINEHNLKCAIEWLKTDKI